MQKPNRKLLNQNKIGKIGDDRIVRHNSPGMKVILPQAELEFTRCPRTGKTGRFQFHKFRDMRTRQNPCMTRHTIITGLHIKKAIRHQAISFKRSRFTAAVGPSQRPS